MEKMTDQMNPITLLDYNGELNDEFKTSIIQDLEMTVCLTRKHVLSEISNRKARIGYLQKQVLSGDTFARMEYYDLKRQISILEPIAEMLQYTDGIEKILSVSEVNVQ
jgi:hypothetical protein